MARLVDPTLCIRLGGDYGKRMRAAFVSLSLVLLTATVAPTWASPERAQGISMHMLPKRVADSHRAGMLVRALTDASASARLIRRAAWRSTCDDEHDHGG